MNPSALRTRGIEALGAQEWFWATDLGSILNTVNNSVVGLWVLFTHSFTHSNLGIVSCVFLIWTGSG